MAGSRARATRSAARGRPRLRSIGRRQAPMDKIIRILLGTVLLALMMPARAVADADDPDAATQRLLDAETARIAAMSRFASAIPPPPPAPRPRAIGDPSAICGAAFTRRVAVASSNQLLAALATARPGDLIQLADGLYR